MKTVHSFKKYVTGFRRFYIVTFFLIAVFVLLSLLRSWNLGKAYYETDKIWNREVRRGDYYGQEIQKLKDNIQKVKSGEVPEGPQGESLEFMEQEYLHSQKARKEISNLKDGELYIETTPIESCGLNSEEYGWIQAPAGLNSHRIKDAGESMVQPYLLRFINILYFLPLVFLFCLYFKYAQKTGEEYMRQLPFSQRQWYVYEAVMGYVVSILLPAVLAVLFAVILKLAGYHVGKFLLAVFYLTVCATFNYTFVIMVKEFAKNAFYGVVWGSVVLLSFWGLVISINRSCPGAVNISQMGICFASIVFLLIGYAAAIRYKLQDRHTFHSLLVRVAIVVILCGSMLYNVCAQQQGKYRIFLTLFTMVSCYILVDLRYIGQSLSEGITKWREAQKWRNAWKSN